MSLLPRYWSMHQASMRLMAAVVTSGVIGYFKNTGPALVKRIRNSYGGPWECQETLKML